VYLLRRRSVEPANLATMRASVIWLVLAMAWGIDSALAFIRHNRQQTALTAFFACCFLTAGLALRKRERRASSNKL
jgi:hypothetical protein